MNKFFAGLRRMFLAYKPYRDIVLGNIALQVIDDVFIPKLQDRFEKENDEGKKQKLMELIALWQKFGSRGDQAKDWNAIAGRTMNYVGRAFGRADTMAEELAQDVAGNFYTVPSNMASLERFDPEQGPLAFLKLWKTILANQAKNILRTFSHQPGVTDSEEWLGKKKPSTDEEDGAEDPLGLAYLESHYQTQEDAEAFEDLLEEMHDSVKSALTSDKISSRIFQQFWKLAQDRSPDTINVKREIYAPIQEEFAAQGIEVGNSTMEFKWRTVQREMLKFYEHTFHKPIPFNMRKKLKLIRASIAERIAYDEFKVSVARWLLAGIYRPNLPYRLQA